MTRFSFRDKRLFEIREVEITRVDCISIFKTKRDDPIHARMHKLICAFAHGGVYRFGLSGNSVFLKFYKII